MTYARSASAAALLAVALALGSCASRSPYPDPRGHYPAAAAAAEHTRLVDERKEDVIRQLSICESGGYGTPERPIYGYRGLYLGRLQFSVRTVIAYVHKRDGVVLTPREATTLAHDHERAADLAKYMLFDLEEPHHWPVCSRRLGLPAQIAAIKQL